MILPTHALHTPPPTRSPKAWSDSSTPDFVTVLAETGSVSSDIVAQDTPTGPVSEGPAQIGSTIPDATLAAPSSEMAVPVLVQPVAEFRPANTGQGPGRTVDSPRSNEPEASEKPARIAPTPPDLAIVPAKVLPNFSKAAMAFADRSAEQAATSGYQHIARTPDIIKGEGRNTAPADLALGGVGGNGPSFFKTGSNKAENTSMDAGQGPLIPAEPRPVSVVPPPMAMEKVAPDFHVAPRATPASMTRPFLAERTATASDDLRPRQDMVRYGHTSSDFPRSGRPPVPIAGPPSLDVGLPDAPPSSTDVTLPSLSTAKEPAPVSKNWVVPGRTSPLPDAQASPMGESQDRVQTALTKGPVDISPGHFETPKPPQPLPAQPDRLSTVDPDKTPVAPQDGPFRLVPVGQLSTSVHPAPKTVPHQIPLAPERVPTQPVLPAQPFVPSDSMHRAEPHHSAGSPAFAPISHLSQTQPAALFPALASRGPQPTPFSWPHPTDPRPSGAGTAPVTDDPVQALPPPDPGLQSLPPAPPNAFPPASHPASERPGSAISQDIAKPELVLAPHPLAVERILHITPEIALSFTPALDAVPAALGPTHAVSPQATFSHAAQSDQRPVPLTSLPAAVMHLIQSNPDGPITLILSPEDLGTLRFQVTQTDQGMNIHLVVDRPETLDLVRRQGEQLLSDLRQAGFSDASLSYADHGSENLPQRQNAEPSVPDPQDTALRQDAPTPLTRSMPASGALDLRL